MKKVILKSLSPHKMKRSEMKNILGGATSIHAYQQDQSVIFKVDYDGFQFSVLEHDPNFAIFNFGEGTLEKLATINPEFNYDDFVNQLMEVQL